jgi:alcohol dehydrogenase class IV
MDNFSFSLPETSLLFGKGTLGQVGERAKRHGSHALLVTGKGSMKKLGFLQKAEKSLKDAGLKVTVFEGVEPNPTADTVNRGMKLGRDKGCDVVVAIGGGSAIDAAKAMAVGIGHADEDIWPYVVREKETTNRTLPVVAIPSTSGTGSHVTWYTVITNSKGEKVAYSSKFIYPKESIVDLGIVSAMPQGVTAETGFDALAHVMESYLSAGANPVTDLLCLRAMELIAQNLPRAYADGKDMDARCNMALADTYAGMCITPSRTIMVHAMGNVVSGIYPHISHGRALACLTGPVMRFNIEKGDEKIIARYCDVARALGEDVEDVDKETALKSVDGVLKLLRAVDIGTSMKNCGAKESDVERLTDYAIRYGAGAMGCNPVKASRKEVIQIYKESF